MFRVLIESGSRHLTFDRGSLVSVVTHTILISLAVASGGQVDERFVDDELSNERVQFLVPMDRFRAPPPQEHSISWVDPGSRSGNEGIEDRPVEKDAPVATTVMSRGTETGPPEREAEPAIELPAVYDSVATVLEVDSAVRRFPDSAAPVYPAELLAQHIEGGAYVQFVVDTTGRPDTSSFRVINATHAGFAAAVRAALPGMRFSPAIMHSRKVRQLVEQPFMFKIVEENTAATMNPFRIDPSS
jgi:TonB family protein